MMAVPVLGGPAQPVVILDANGNVISSFGGSGGSTTIAAPLGRAADAASVSAALSTEDVALLNSLITLLAGGLPAALGQGTMAQGLRVVLPSNQSSIPVAGNAAEAAAVSGNPVFIAGKDGSGNTRSPLVTATGRLVGVAALGGSSFTDGNTGGVLWMTNQDTNNWGPVGNLIFNGSNWDRQRGTTPLTLLSSSARTADTNSSDQTNYNWCGLIIILNVSAQSGGSVKLGLQLKDSISGNYVTVWTATAAQTAVGTYTYLLYPGALDAASWTEKVQLAGPSRTWRITTTTANGSSITYSVSADMLL